jgi:hypothetical protein
LDVRKNLISKIQTVDELHQLNALDLSRNRISVLENLEPLTFLEFLWIGENRIHSIFLTEPLLSLTFLHASLNYLHDFVFHSRFPNLTTLELDYCFISNLSSFRGLTSLHRLSVAHNQLCADQFLELPNLTALNISHNFLVSIDFLKPCQNLEILDISFNPIDDDGFSTDFVFRRLTVLNISSTKLRQASSLNFAPSLRGCSFANLAVQDLTSFLESRQHLTELDLRGTPGAVGLYFDAREYASLADYDRLYPESAPKRAEHRRAILALVPGLARLDGISTAPELAGGTLDALLDERRRLRGSLGLPPDELRFRTRSADERDTFVRAVAAEVAELRAARTEVGKEAHGRGPPTTEQTENDDGRQQQSRSSEWETESRAESSQKDGNRLTWQSPTEAAEEEEAGLQIGRASCRGRVEGGV